MNEGTLAEWSKALDLSPNIERCVGLNPTGTIFYFLKFEKKTEIILRKFTINFYILFLKGYKSILFMRETEY